MKNYYAALDITRSASDEMVRKQYRKLAMRYHPDHNPGDAEAEAKFKEAAEAYKILGDSDTRREYNKKYDRKYGRRGSARRSGSRSRTNGKKRQKSQAGFAWFGEKTARIGELFFIPIAAAAGIYTAISQKAEQAAERIGRWKELVLKRVQNIGKKLRRPANLYTTVHSKYKKSARWGTSQRRKNQKAKKRKEERPLSQKSRKEHKKSAAQNQKRRLSPAKKEGILHAAIASLAQAGREGSGLAVKLSGKLLGRDSTESAAIQEREERGGLDIVYYTPLTAKEMEEGKTITVQVFGGSGISAEYGQAEKSGDEVFKIRIPQGSKSGQKLRIKGKGHITGDCSKRGDLYLQLEEI